MFEVEPSSCVSKPIWIIEKHHLKVNTLKHNQTKVHTQTDVSFSGSQVGLNEKRG